MMRLYCAPGACSLGIHIALNWIGCQYQLNIVNPHDEDYLKINPAGAVPAMTLDNGHTLTQNAAIYRYLMLTYPEADLGVANTPLAQAELERWSAFLTGDLHPSFYPLFSPGRYSSDHSEQALAQIKAAALTQVRRKLALLDAHLHEKTHMVGNKRTVVDAYVYPMLRWATKMVPGGLADYPQLQRLFDDLSLDPDVQKALKEEGLA
ncbi:glutathione binding-like protein [Gallaecimonas sp. GXIMD4217]|uniref:glutathione S-transferase family protein n=1 Tax=Gallaecimonas sp. GXIMD4217 TaxID=3131927 RepID=UPI00311AD049